MNNNSTSDLKNTESAKNTATRIKNAHKGFCETLMYLSGCSEEDARQVTSYYLANKIAKLDPIMGVIRVQNGIFLEADVIAEAIAQN